MGLSALARKTCSSRAHARLIGGKLTSKNGGNAGFLPCYFPFRSYGTKNRSQSPWNRPIGARLANLTSETSSQLTPPSSGESANHRFLSGGARSLQRGFYGWPRRRHRHRH